MELITMCLMLFFAVNTIFIFSTQCEIFEDSKFILFILVYLSILSTFFAHTRCFLNDCVVSK